VTTDLLNKYVLQCQGEGLSDATINRDLAALKKAFNLAYRSTPRKIQQVPAFPHLKESAPRKGFVEEPQYRELCKHAAGQLWFRSMLAIAYTFGFRKSELLEMRCEQVNLFDGTVCLWRGTTKSDEPRHVKLTRETKTLIAASVAGKQPSDYVFTRKDGQRIRDFRESWATLCEAAGVPELLFHDLRRSAVRNLTRAGVPELVAMSISGHK
jgi:integrase